MTAADLLERLRAEGFSLVPEGGGICVRPASRLTAAWRQAIRTHKAELFVLLAATEVAAPAPPGPTGPTPPPGARLFFEGHDGRPCGPGGNVRLWTWEGAPRCYYADVDPPPGARKERGRGTPPGGSGANARR
jgi:hypothetical protein